MKLGALLVLAVVGAMVVACNKPADPASDSAPKPTTSATQTTPPAGGSGGGVAPLGPNVGGMTPVAGSDSVEGSGGGSVGSAAKDMARRTAAGAGAPAGMGSTTGDGTDGE